MVFNPWACWRGQSLGAEVSSRSSTTEISFNEVLAPWKHVIIWLLTTKEGHPLTVCSWAMMIIMKAAITKIDLVKL